MSRPVSGNIAARKFLLPGGAGALCALCLLLTGITLLYRPALSGPFLFDDFSNLLRNPDMLAYAAGHYSLSGVLAHGAAGPLGRPLALLTLAWQFQAHGPSSLPFKQFNLLVHLCNTVLVWMFVCQLARLRGLRQAPAWALLAAALWALHPLALTPVLYVVQRMASLATLGLLIALNAALAGRRCLAEGRPAWGWLLGGVPLGLLFAVLSKESGALLPAYLAVLECTLLATAPLPAAAAADWRRFLRWAVWLPALALVLLLPWVVPALLRGYQTREFDAAQRLWTEARVLWLYARMLFLPSLAQMGLYHDDVVLSTGWLQPWTTLPAVLGLLLLVACTVGLRRRAPLFAFGSGFFLVSQLIESTLVPLELMHEHRVYLGMLGPLLALVLALAGRIEAGAMRAWRPRSMAAMAALPVLILALLTGQRVAAWSDPMTLAQMEVAHHPASVRAEYDLAEVYDVLASRSQDPADRRRLLALALEPVRQAIAAAPADSKPWLALLLICSQANADCAAPPEAWQRLESALARDHRAHLMLADVQALVECSAQGDCRFPTGAVSASLAALGSNPMLGAEDRQLLAGLRDAAGRLP